MTYKPLHPRNDVGRLYVSIKEGGRGLASIQDSIDALIQRLEDYIKKPEERLITATRNNIDNTCINWTKIATKIGRKSDKQVKSHARKLGHG